MTAEAWDADVNMRDTYDDILCPYGNCKLWRDRVTLRIDGGIGHLDCPCDHTPGWRSAFIDGIGKPHPPVLPKGRRASRVVRSRRRHAAGDVRIAAIRAALARMTEA